MSIALSLLYTRVFLQKAGHRKTRKEFCGADISASLPIFRQNAPDSS
jgi:hypothetical protein